MRDATPLAEPLEVDAAESQATASRRLRRLRESPPQGLVRRALTLVRHLGGLALGACADRERRRPGATGSMPGRILVWTGARLARLLVAGDLRSLPFSVQLRRRLELLGPTFIKLGQVLAVRSDLLPRTITSELAGLLDRLPAVDYDRFRALVSDGLGQPAETLFAWIETQPIGSASIAQIHRASTREGDAVILKVVKPGIRHVLERDARLLRWLGRLLQLPLARFQPRRVIDELVTYTLFEVDMEREADNAETFAAHFADQGDIVFPKVYRHLSGKSVLTMDFFAGVRPDSRAAQDLTDAERQRIIDLGAQAIVRMIYRDGFFHADLHPGNLLVLKGPKAGFIDLGMVGRLEERTRRTLLSYYYCLIMGDAEGAARYLSMVAEPQRRSDAEGFRRAIAELSRRFHRGGEGAPTSLAQLILDSIALGGRYRMFFPVEMVLMVKALITFEGVGNQLEPGFDFAAASRRHVAMVLLDHVSPLRVAREGLRLAPELIDALSRAPLLVTEGLRFLERGTAPAPEARRTSSAGAVFGGLCIVAGAVTATGNGPWPLTATLFVIGLGAAWTARP